MPTSSPVAGQREPKISCIEVPLTVLHDKLASEVGTSEDLKRIQTVTGEMSENVKGVKERVDAIESLLKEGRLFEQDKMEALQKELDALRQLRQAEQHLQEEVAEHERTRQVAEEARQAAVEAVARVDEVQSTAHKREGELQQRLQQLEEQLGEVLQRVEEKDTQLQVAQRVALERETQLEETRRAVQERQEQLEHAQRAAMRSMEQLEEAQRVALHKEEELEVAREMAQAKQVRGERDIRDEAFVAELERKVKIASEECNTYKVRFSHLQYQVDQKTDENAELREQLHQRVVEVSQLRERLDLETAALTQENRNMDSRLSVVNGQLQALSIEHRALQAQCAHHEQALQEQQERHERALEEQLAQQDAKSGFALMEQQLAQRERELADLQSQVNSYQHALAAKEDEVRAAQLEARALAQQRAVLEQQQRELERQLELRTQEIEQQAQEFREKARKLADHDKENKSLKQTVQEQKSILWDLENQLHREQTIANFITPGEYIRLAKKQEGELFAQDNADLKLRNFGLETEVRQVRWHNEVMKKHLPRSAWEEVAREVHAQPLPVRQPATEATEC